MIMWYNSGRIFEQYIPMSMHAIPCFVVLYYGLVPVLYPHPLELFQLYWGNHEATLKEMHYTKLLWSKFKCNQSKTKHSGTTPMSFWVTMKKSWNVLLCHHQGVTLGMILLDTDQYELMRPSLCDEIFEERQNILHNQYFMVAMV